VRLHIPRGLAGVADALAGEAGRAGAVLAAEPRPPADFPALERELLAFFRLSREAFEAGEPIVYVLSQPDLLGQRGALGAMRAGALLSAARTLALEGARTNLRVNAVALAENADAEQAATWIRHLLADGGVSGELVRVGGGHAGKVLA
jgi:hypothetical protein